VVWGSRGTAEPERGKVHTLALFLRQRGVLVEKSLTDCESVDTPANPGNDRQIREASVPVVCQILQTKEDAWQEGKVRSSPAVTTAGWCVFFSDATTLRVGGCISFGGGGGSRTGHSP